MVLDPHLFNRLVEHHSKPDAELTFARPSLDFAALGLRASYCHTNSTLWTEQNPEYTRVRGWIVWPRDEWGPIFIPHSLVQGPDGELIDVTPYESEQARGFATRFIRHPGSDKEFDVVAVVGAEGVSGDDLSEAAGLYPSTMYDADPYDDANWE